MRFNRTTYRRIATIGILVSLLTLGVRPFLFHTAADKLPNRSLRLDTPTQGSTTKYTFTFDITTTSSVGSIRFQFCSDTPLVEYPCTAPAGFDASGAVLNAQSGESGFSVASNTTANDVYVTRTAGPTVPGTASYQFSNVLNPSSVGTYFVRIQTYGSTDGSGPSIDAGGLAFVINNSVSISTVVPPYLLLCTGVVIQGYDCTTASGDYMKFGELSASATKTGQTQIVVATNADNGYSLWADGTTMTAGNDIIPALETNDVSRPGTSQFGINLVANSTPRIGENVLGPGIGTVAAGYGTPDRFRYVPGEQIASAADVSDYRKYTVSYIININKAQPPGIYISTFSYVSLANF